MALYKCRCTKKEYSYVKEYVSRIDPWVGLKCLKVFNIIPILQLSVKQTYARSKKELVQKKGCGL